MSKIRLLVVEDDPNLGQILREYLEVKGFDATLAQDGEAGMQAYRQGEFDLCILDVMLPKKDGFTLAREIREGDTRTPLLFLTARGQQQDTLEGFKAGADDYMSKPFSMEELLMRIKAILRRSGSKEEETQQTEFTIGDLRFIHPEQKILKSDGEVMKVTTREADLLRLLCLHKNQTLPRSYALKEIWNDDSYFNARTMDVYVTKLRKLLRFEPRAEIVTVHGEGFRLLVKD
ncbi:response regulator transcription factor [Roseivirga sp. BDSF3-8]|uniref:response regulator transcription factor n=1 Tax=Roseivirga sp. BDSF3-8 TaxID=3241598 RepID=UPI0035324FB1